MECITALASHVLASTGLNCPKYSAHSPGKLHNDTRYDLSDDIHVEEEDIHSLK